MLNNTHANVDRVTRKFQIHFELDINENGAHKKLCNAARIVNIGKFTTNTTLKVYIKKKKGLI